MWTIHNPDGSTKKLTDSEVSKLKEIPSNFVGNWVEEIRINTYKGIIVIRRDDS